MGAHQSPLSHSDDIAMCAPEAPQDCCRIVLSWNDVFHAELGGPPLPSATEVRNCLAT